MEESISGENSITRIAFDQSYGDPEPSSPMGSNTGGGQKIISEYFCSIPLIKRFMPTHIIPYHIAWKADLPLSDRTILWTHYVPIVDHKEKLLLLNVTDVIYTAWLATAQRKIDQEICELPEPAPAPSVPGGAGIPGVRKGSTVGRGCRPSSGGRRARRWPGAPRPGGGSRTREGQREPQDRDDRGA